MKMTRLFFLHLIFLISTVTSVSIATTYTLPQRQSCMFILSLISSAYITISVAIEELHDLDVEHKIHDDSEKKKENIIHNNEYTERPIPNKPNVHKTIDRFTRVIANEIMRRLPWRRRNRSRRRRKKHKMMYNNKKKKDGYSISNHVDIQNKRRVGAWCPPNKIVSDDSTDDTSTESTSSSYGEVEIIGDKSIVAVSCSDSKSTESTPSDDSCEVERSDLIANDVQPGMVVYVFAQDKQRQEHSTSALERFHSDTYYDGTFDDKSIDAEGRDESSIRGIRCVNEMGQYYDNDKKVVQYTLLEQEPVELGHIDIHRIDFAYQPVVLGIDSGFGQGSELEARNLDVPSSYPTSTGDDHAVSFRWWSWVSHINQMLHNEKTSIDDDGMGLFDPAEDDPSFEQQYSYQSNIYEEDGKSPFAGGSHGDIWKARRRCPISGNNNITSSCDDGKDLIVKRLKIEHGYPVLEAGLREVYFGELLAREALSSTLFTTYVDHFFREGTSTNQLELWIVYENAGTSLRSFLYTPVDTGGYVVFQNSEFWRRLRRGIDECEGCNEDESLTIFDTQHQKSTNKHSDKSNKSKGDTKGGALLREVLKQLITSVAFLHERGIVHRDIKPSNIMCKTGSDSDRIKDLRCILGDFSSGYNDYVTRNLYTSGPSSSEQTIEYSPPEVLPNDENPYSYDSWSVGVVALELLLGTPNVFSVDQRTTALLTNRLKKEGTTSKQDIQRALYLAALSQFCIYEPTEAYDSWPFGHSDPLYRATFVKNKCTLKDFHNALRARDPLGLGFSDDANTLLHLIWRLLDYNPSKRLGLAEALQHPYFTSQGTWNPMFLHTQLFPDDIIAVKPGEQQHALEHQTLDPKVDMSSDITMVSEFVCPKCNKTFTDHNSCQQHARSRRHANFCKYDRSLLPPCLNAHSMLPHHPTSGYCDIQGRRKTIEDFHTVHLNGDQQFYGVFDGHLGNLASKYAAKYFNKEIEERLVDVDDMIRRYPKNWREYVESRVIESFKDIHRGIIKAVESSPGGVMDESGTTSTFVFLTGLAVIIANVGDSRAIMSQWSNGNDISAIQLTVDHVASSAVEQKGIIERGGFISQSGGIDRVNGSLAVSRSLGDIKLAPFLSQTPHILALTKEEALEQCGNLVTTGVPCFIILASDGLWDVMSNKEAVDLAWQVIKENTSGTAYQEAAAVLTQEAYVRGSSDNIGVCVLAIT